MRSSLIKGFCCLALIGAVYTAQSQCRMFTKKKCMPTLLPFLHNGQMNNIMLFPGETASLSMTFFAEQEYRLVICSQDILGDGVYFVVKTESGKEVYSSEHEENNAWDFNVASTQNLVVEVVIPADDETLHAIETAACVAIIVGFQGQ